MGTCRVEGLGNNFPTQAVSKQCPLVTLGKGIAASANSIWQQKSLQCKHEGQDEGEYWSESCPAGALHAVQPRELTQARWSHIWVAGLVGQGDDHCSLGPGVILSFPPLSSGLGLLPTQTQGEDGELRLTP